jgi:ubiquilin
MTGTGHSPDDLLRQFDDPNFAQQMREAMDNPMVISMLEQSPMVRDNPVVREMIRNPATRRALFSPEVMRAQLEIQRNMQGGGNPEDNFPAPGATDNTPQAGGQQPPTAGGLPGQSPPAVGGAPPANPFASLFGQRGAAPPGSAFPGAQNPGQSPFGQVDPAMLAQLLGGAGGAGGAGGQGGAAANPFGGGQYDLNALMEQSRAMFGDAQQTPQDTRPPEERFANQLRQLNDMGFFEFERNIEALRRSGGSVQGAIEYLLTNPSS